MFSIIFFICYFLRQKIYENIYQKDSREVIKKATGGQWKQTKHRKESKANLALQLKAFGDQSPCMSVKFSINPVSQKNTQGANEDVFPHHPAATLPVTKREDTP